MKKLEKIVAAIALILGGAAASRATNPTEFETATNYFEGVLNYFLDLVLNIILMGRKVAPEFKPLARKLAAVFVGALFLILVGCALDIPFLSLVTGGILLALAFPLFLISKKIGEAGKGPGDTQKGFFNGIAAIFGIAMIYLSSICMLQFGLGGLVDWLGYVVWGSFFLFSICFYIYYRIQGHVGYGGLLAVFLTGAVALGIGFMVRVAPDQYNLLVSYGKVYNQETRNQTDTNNAQADRKLVKVTVTVGKYQEVSGYVPSFFGDSVAWLFSKTGSYSPKVPKKTVSLKAVGELAPGTYTRLDGYLYQSPKGGDTLIRLADQNKFGENVGVEESDSFFAVLDGTKVQLVNGNSTVGSIADISIPLSSYTQSNWDLYSGYEGNADNPKNLWMRAVGQVSFPFQVSEVRGSSVKFTVTLSSELGPELEGKVKGFSEYSSDVTVEVNGVSAGSQNVIADDGSGKQYSFSVPATALKAGQNTITLKVKEEDQHKNGLTIHSAILGNFL